MYISNKVYRGYLSMTVFYLPIHIKCSCIEFTKSSSKPRAKFKKRRGKKKGGGKKESKVNYFRFCTQPPGPGLFVGWARGSARLGESGSRVPWGGQEEQAGSPHGMPCRSAASSAGAGPWGALLPLNKHISGC